MRKSLMILPALLACFQFGYSQQTTSFILQGTIENCPENELLFYYEDSNYVQYVDTIYLQNNGAFYLRIDDIKKAQVARIAKNKIGINSLFVAPGYNLTIKANGIDYKTLNTTKRISGVGSESNLYNVLIDSILLSQKEDTLVYYKKFPRALSEINSEIRLRDSIADVVFIPQNGNDKYSTVFDTTVRIDNRFIKLAMLLSYFDIQSSPIKWQMEILHENIDADLLVHICDDRYLVSASYNLIIAGSYLKYLLAVDEYNNPSLGKSSGYVLRKIMATYTGSVRDYALNYVMRSHVKMLTNVESYVKSKKLITEYIPKIDNVYYRKSLNFLLAQQEMTLMSTTKGSNAPVFSLEDNQGNVHSLNDFKGKVVYLDFWATWCGPCLKEMPMLSELYQKYRSDERVEIVSICVGDTRANWNKKLKKDGFKWLQLIDKDNIVSDSYLAQTIPRYVLIGKSGKLASFDAPRPSSGKELTDMINDQLTRQSE